MAHAQPVIAFHQRPDRLLRIELATIRRHILQYEAMIGQLSVLRDVFPHSQRSVGSVIVQDQVGLHSAVTEINISPKQLEELDEVHSGRCISDHEG
jgi:hypothetical protein